MAKTHQNVDRTRRSFQNVGVVQFLEMLHIVEDVSVLFHSCDCFDMINFMIQLDLHFLKK